MTDHSTPNIRKVSEADIPALAKLLARAFDADPFSRWVHPDDQQREEAFVRGFETELSHILLPLGACYTDTELRGAALWAPPGQWQLSPMQQIKLLPPFIRAFGLLRLPTVFMGYSHLDKHHPEDPPHWYLSVLGVDPEHHGKGLGAALIKPVLDQCDRDGTPAYLESANERNLSFYKRNGFEVREETEIPRGPRVWCMWRDPQPE
jgi:ribosomal protein S18 acetylase RimI-like enzyme